jgi:amino acid adenylation domain-containing protein/non-ribosomal peptide synthase protein (TIGR01720 family)
MRILLAANSLYYPAYGGASKVNELLLSALAKRGHRCGAVVPGAGIQAESNNPYELERTVSHRFPILASTAQGYEFLANGVSVCAVRDHAALSEKLKATVDTFHPDCIIVTSEDAGSFLLERALNVGRPVVYLAHTTQMLPSGPASFFPSASKRELLGRCAGVIAVSRYVQQYLHRYADIESAVLPIPAYGDGPFPNLAAQSGYITMVNPCKVKGIDIFLELAAKLPDLAFAAVPTWGTTAADLASLRTYKNVCILPPVANVDDLFCATSILTVPSLWDEAFGRIVVEAMLRGVPVIASNAGGLPEAKLGVDYVVPVQPIQQYLRDVDERMCPRPIVPKQDISEWIATVGHLKEDAALYSSVSAGSYEAARAFVAGLDIEPVEEYLRKSSSRSLVPAQVSPASEAATADPGHQDDSLARQALLAAKVRGKRRQSPERAPLEIPVAIERGPAPLSFAQERLWFLHQFDAGSPFYNESIVLRLKGEVDISLVRYALDRIADRHEVLRTRFSATGDENPTAIPQTALLIDFDVLDFSGSDRTSRETETINALTELAKHPFDLAVGPLLRTRLGHLDSRHHLLLIAAHHIIVDNWSLSIFLHEFAAFYAQRSESGTSSPPPLRIQYGDFARWQRDTIRGAALEEGLEFWRRKLAGVPELQLPCRGHRTASLEGESFRFLIPKGMTSSLRRFAKYRRVTLFQVLLTAFQTVLHLFSDQDMVLTGTPVTNRITPGTETMIGCFANILVFPGDFRLNPTVDELITRTSRIAVEAQQHSHIPFEKVVETIQPDRNPEKHPLFQVMFALQATPAPPAHFAGLDLEVLRVSLGTTKFDLYLDVTEQEDSLLGVIEYKTHLFERAMVARIAEQFYIVLDTMVKTPQILVSRIPLVTGAEYDRIVKTWNENARLECDEEMLHSLFERQVSRSPNATAIVDANRPISYAELDAWSNRIGHMLRDLGIASEDRIGVCLERTPGLIAVLLGILKSGAAYVALDPAYPADRLRYIASDSASRALFIEGRSRELFVGYAGLLLEASNASDYSSAPLNCQVSPRSAAYLLYTSGSTGRPKGAVLEHRNATTFLSWARNTFPSELKGCVAASTSICFDSSIMEIFGPLIAGGSVLMVSNALALAELRDEPRIDMISSVPSAVREICHAPVFRHVSTVIMAGEPISRQMLDDIQAGAPSASLFNLYGLTEVTTYSTMARLKPGPDQPPIGRPIQNTQVYIVDRNLRPVPPGMTGELYIGGDGLARGYWSRPALTAQRFLPDPFSGRKGGRLYRTGDRARWRVDGQIELLGRVDSQIKLRGYRIELREVEAVLKEHPEVREAVAFMTESNGGQLIAYVTGISAAEICSTDLATWTRAKLPEYMIPTAIEVLEAMPLTPNGKLDRNALSVPDTLAKTRDASLVSARDRIEEVIVDVWREVLNLPEVGIYDDFFDLGGHSLLAVRVASRLGSAFRIPVPVRLLFTERTVDRFAKEVAKAIRNSPTPLPPPLRALKRTEATPLSFSQEQLWFLDQSHPDAAINSLSACLQVQGELNLGVLQRSLDQLIERHESLRTSFSSAHGEPVASIAPEAAVNLERLEIGGGDEAANERRLTELAREFALRPLALDTSPLLRALIVSLGPFRHALLINLHHMICDGWSLGILIRELGELYRSGLEGTEFHLPPLPYQYSDFTIWQREQLESGAFDQQIEFWKKVLRPTDCSLKLSTDRARPARPSLRGSRVDFTIDPVTVGQMKKLATGCAATLFMVLAAAVKSLLLLSTGEQTITLRTPVAGRNTTETEGIVGSFVNELVLQTTLNDNPTFRQVLNAVRETALAAFANSDVPFARVVRELQPTRNPKYQPFSQVTLAVQNTQPLELKIPGATVELVELATGFSKMDLHFNARERSGALLVTLTYNSDLFDEVTAQRMANDLKNLLESSVRDPDRRLTTSSLSHGTAPGQVLQRYGAGNWNRPVLVQDRIARQARLRPNAIAVVFDAEETTYAALQRRSNRLARELRRRGVIPEDRVAVCLERSSEVVIALLGILRSGGVYVPLDFKQPQQRLRYLLDDTRPKLLITDAGTEGVVSRPGLTTIRIDRLLEAPDEGDSEDPLGSARPDNSAYIIYTSGSTGLPKGVIITHAGLMNMSRAQSEVFAVSPHDRVLQFAALTFDASIFEIILCLTSGATLYVFPAWRSLSGDQFYRLLEDKQITVATLPPSIVTGASLKPLSSLKKLILAGEQPSPKVIEDWAPGRLLFNAYGPTETSVWASTAICDRETPANVIGRPIPRADVYILDSEMQPVSIGMKGEIYVGGQGIARGYLNRPALTAIQFVPNPFSEEPGERLYRTGDMGVWRSDGQVAFLGRSDSQVKIRGHRIELGEIETTIRHHRDVLDAVAIDLEDISLGRRIVTYVVAHRDAKNIAESILKHCAQVLPDYEIPSAVEVLDAFPLTGNGKIDRTALPVPTYDKAEPRDTVSGMRNPSEELLLQIFRDVLNKPGIGIHDNFFGLGGDSILSIQVTGRAIAAGINASPADIFEYQTVAKLAQARPISEATPEQGEIEQVSEAPLTSIQKWFFERNLAEPNHYNQAIVLEPSEKIVLSVLGKSLDDVVRHHDSFRLRFEQVKDGVRQYLGEPAKQVLHVVDISGLPQTQQDAAYDQTSDLLQRSLDLARGPVTRVVWFESGEDKASTLLWIAHHLVIDWVSWRILMEDLTQRYLSYQRSCLPQAALAHATSFLSWANKINQRVQSGVFDHLLPIWLEPSIPPMEPSVLQVDFSGGENAVAFRQKQIVSFSEEMTRSLLEQLPAVPNFQITEVLLTALESALAEWNGLSPLTVDVEGHGREDILSGFLPARTVGWFTSVYPVTMNDRSPQPDTQRALAHMQEKVSRAGDHGISYGLLRYLGSARQVQALQHRPQAEVGFNYLGQFDGTLSQLQIFRRSNLSPGEVESLSNALPYKISIVAYVLTGCLHMEWTFSGRSYRNESIARLAGAYSRLLLRIIHDVQNSEIERSRAEHQTLEAALSEVEFNQ